MTAAALSPLVPAVREGADSVNARWEWSQQPAMLIFANFLPDPAAPARHFFDTAMQRQREQTLEQMLFELDTACAKGTKKNAQGYKISWKGYKLHVAQCNAWFEWRESGCSLCFYAGGEGFEPGSRTISSTNRNFEGRQGPGIRTHIASPEMVAASALAGCIADPRDFAS